MVEEEEELSHLLVSGVQGQLEEELQGEGEEGSSGMHRLREIGCSRCLGGGARVRV